jgi:hypothetical protein
MAKKKKITALSAEAVAWKDRILTDYVIEDSGSLLVLEKTLEAYDRLREAQGILQRDGICIKDRFGVPQVHPMCRVERDSRIAVLRGLKQLELDIEVPKSRGPHAA